MPFQAPAVQTSIGNACSGNRCVLQVIQDTAVKMGLTPEDDFILRVVQLSELLAIRHCVFLMGPTGSGRSECYKVLAKAIQTGSDKPMNTYLEATNRKKVGPMRMYASRVCHFDQAAASLVAVRLACCRHAVQLCKAVLELSHLA